MLMLTGCSSSSDDDTLDNGEQTVFDARLLPGCWVVVKDGVQQNEGVWFSNEPAFDNGENKLAKYWWHKDPTDNLHRYETTYWSTGNNGRISIWMCEGGRRVTRLTRNRLTIENWYWWMDSDVALKLLKKYGFNSVNDSPYLSIINNKFGLSIKYNDRCFGWVERTTLFNDEKEFEQFLKCYRKYLNYGKGIGINIRLDDYQIMFPNILFVKDEKIVLVEEMLNGFEVKDSLSELDRLKVVAKNLLNYYDDLSTRQVKHINNVGVMNNLIIKKEKLLQEELIKIKKRRKVDKIETIKEEIFRYDNSLYNSYVEYLNRVTTKEQASKLITSLWNLNRKLELSKDYYKSLITCKELGEKIRLIDYKIDYVRSLKGKNLLLVNVNANLKQIEESFSKNKIDTSFVDEELNKIKRKYSMFDKVAMVNLDEYLKEALLYDNYDYLVTKYVDSEYKSISKNEVISNLRKSYQLLSFDERRVLTLFNSKYRNIFDLILEIPDFSEWPNKKMTKYLEGIESVSRFKEECIDELCTRLVLETNRSIREKYFVDVSFKSFKFFVKDMVNLLMILNDKMVLNSDVELFSSFETISSLKNKYVYYLANNINSILGSVATKKHVIGIFKILKGTPVLYSPYNIDFGDLYDKNSKVIKEVNNNKIGLVIDVNDVMIMRDRKLSDVYYYKNIIDKINGISVVTDIKYINKVSYCNFTIHKR